MSTDKMQRSTDETENRLARMKQLIRDRLTEKGISAREASRRSGLNVGYVGDFLESRSKSPDFSRIMRLAETLEIPTGDLIDESDAAPLAHLAASAPAPAGNTIPLFGARIAINKPWVSIDWSPIDHVFPIPTLNGVADAYAVVVFNDLNAPRYFLGETIFVAPRAPIGVGDFIFARGVDGRCSIGRLASADGETAAWQLMSSGELADSPMSALISLHRIMGSIG